ncbi:MAG: diaminopimelate decarboxylase [Desulfatiglans sp.]|jgi:diaminopimelate decarboxylase|nr:diaminopimelate decarboxylase [Desulfatiglans sp.]
MHYFQYKNNDLYCEEFPIKDIAQEVGTPLYVYSHRTLEKHFLAFDEAFAAVKHLTCFSMKSNSNLSILRLFARKGGGLDIVSGGELYRAIQAGVVPRKIVFSGVGKQDEELEYALASNILMFNVESAQELKRLDEIARRIGKKAPIALRVNPDVDPKTHPYISTGLKENKFGININEAPEQYALAAGMKNIMVSGVSCHIGSQLTSVSPFVDTIEKLMTMIEQLVNSGIPINYLDIGGGLGITYDDEAPPHPTEYAKALQDKIGMTDMTLILEPGRVIVGNAGILITRVVYSKISGAKTFYIVDAAMNDLMRPSLYNSFHAILPVHLSGRNEVKADIVGPICESGDFLAKDRIVESYEPGELMAVMSAGAYGFTMSSNYNSRPRPCEVMVKDDRFYVIRARETHQDLVRGETIPDFLMDG